jgi:hypothetical protein
MIPAATLLFLLAAAPPVPEEPLPAPSLLGSGLLSLHDTRTLPKGRFTIETTLHNRDRDPLGIDVFDYAVSGTVGITRRIEGYGSVVFSRVVVVPDFSQTWPAPPSRRAARGRGAGAAVPATSARSRGPRPRG